MLYATVLTLLAALAQSAATQVELRPGLWRAWLDSPGGELPFGLELQSDRGAWRAWLINGADRAEIPRVEVNGDELVLAIPHYDSTVRAKISDSGSRVDGEWKKRGRNDKVVRLAFHAAAGDAPRFPRGKGFSNPHFAELDGRWSIQFKADTDAAVAVLHASPDGNVTGTILTPTGDYGFLAGDGFYMGSHPDPPIGDLRLSTFDGAHAFLLVGHFGVDHKTLHGDFWSGDAFHDTWTAKRDDAAALPDAFAQTRFSEGVKLADLSFPDLAGKKRSLGDPSLAGKARIIEVFGSWCPNCNDASRYLVELHRKYKDRGLSIVGLAFEYTGDFQRDAEQVKEFAKYHEIEYPLLLAGVADREKASSALPIIDKLRAYPTIILLDANGKGRAVYTGFSGPATGEEYAKFKVKFEAMIEELLAS